MEVGWPQMYLYTFFILLIGFIFGYIIAKAGYKDRYHADIKEFQDELFRERLEKEKILANQKREIAHAITKEWNRGYSAAYDKLKSQFLFIQKWESEHGLTSGELETFAEDIEKDFKEEN